jgi:outer membrane protein
MKKLVLALVVMMSAATLTAQTKIGHVNSQKLLDTLPSRKAALKDLQTISEAGEKELVEMETEFYKQVEKYNADKINMSPIMQKFEEEKLQKKQQAIQMREQEIQQQLQIMSNELNSPILRRLQKAVDIVAERKKLNYVIDESTTLYFKGGVDLTAEVLVELLKLDAEETIKK